MDNQPTTKPPEYFLNPWQIDRLIALRKRYLQGDFEEKTDEQRRLEFVKHLYLTGRIER